MKNPSQQAKRLEKDGLRKVEVIDSIGRKQKINIVDEPNLYLLILRSNSLESKEFRRRLTREILPQIRKTGKYIDKKEQSLRLKSAKKRNLFTESLKNHGVNKPYEYIQLTYETKTGVGIPRNKKKADYDLIELMKVGIAEDIATLQIELSKPSGYKEVKPIVKKSASIVGNIKGELNE